MTNKPQIFTRLNLSFPPFENSKNLSGKLKISIFVNNYNKLLLTLKTF